MTDRERPLRLGHIVYSNCFPVHARLIDRGAPEGITIVEGVPSRLNGLLERGEIDVAPSSSIEYARNADRYRILPDLVIGSRGPVRSILFLSDRHPSELDGATVAMPTASATSVVLLKVLLRVRWGVAPRTVWFDQAREDPFAAGADAALFIGDVALRGDLFPALPFRFDLGAEWWDQTGLPFAFAVWQAAGGTDAQLGALHAVLKESRAYGQANRAALAARYAEHFGFTPDFLDRYWSDLSYELNEPMIAGLREFYRLAAEIGEIPEAPELRWFDPVPAGG
ncbi:MAG TPA: menaquinone biosynthesis protein [Longimicrobium sp.]|nr:menaquinone biosynthesis protein [Longimicrobium sp.]